MSIELELLLIAAAFIAGLIDTVAGGGGLITVPALLAAGLSPAATLATNKGQAFSGLSIACYSFWRKGEVSLRIIMPGFILSFIGAFFGALAISLIAAKFLSNLVTILLIIIAIYTLLKPNQSHHSTKPIFSNWLFKTIFNPIIGFYDGFFGPGTGSFWAAALVSLRGYSLRQATVETKFYNLASNLGSLVVFVVVGHMVWLIAALMAIGQIAGAKIGAHLVMTRGTSIIKPILVTMSLLITAKLIYSDPDNIVRIAAMTVWHEFIAKP